MIGEFLSSWPLFWPSYAAGWLAGALLSLAGVLVVARSQIFLGAAAAQAAALGLALVLLWGGSAILQTTAAMAFGVAACWIASPADTESERGEALAGWVFLLAGSLSVLVVARSPHGMEEVQRVLASSLIGARPYQIALLGAALVFTLFVLVVRWRPYLLFVADPITAQTVGVHTGAWALASYGWLGLCAGLSIQTAGMLYAFGHLVLPALAARNHCRTLRGLFWAVPLWSLTADTLGFVLANHFDLPPGQAAVALLCLAVGLGAALGRMATGRPRERVAQGA